MTTLQELNGFIGKRYRYLDGTGLSIDVWIRDARMNYGATQFLIEPVAGEGQKWVDVKKLREIKTDEQ